MSIQTVLGQIVCQPPLPPPLANGPFATHIFGQRCKKNLYNKDFDFGNGYLTITMVKMILSNFKIDESFKIVIKSVNIFQSKNCQDWQNCQNC